MGGERVKKKSRKGGRNTGKEKKRLYREWKKYLFYLNVIQYITKYIECVFNTTSDIELYVLIQLFYLKRIDFKHVGKEDL